MKLILASLCVVGLAFAVLGEKQEPDDKFREATGDKIGRPNSRFWPFKRLISRKYETGRNAQEESAAVESEELRAAIPEASNYDDVAISPMWCICCCRRCCNSRSYVQRDIQYQEDSITVLGSKTELKLYSTKDDLLELYNSAVARAALYERLLNNEAKSDSAKALNGRQYGVVVTLEDGRRFLVVKGNQQGEGSDTVAIIADHMTDDWVKISSKTVFGSTLGDFIKAGGHGFDAVSDNGKEAAMRMMALA